MSKYCVNCITVIENEEEDRYFFCSEKCEKEFYGVQDDSEDLPL